jgi:hypothetical protein
MIRKKWKNQNEIERTQAKENEKQFCQEPNEQ